MSATAFRATDPAGTSELIARVLADHPEVVAALDEAHQAAWNATDQRLLEMCRIRAAQLIGCPAEAAARMPGVAVDSAVLDALPSWPTSPCSTISTAPSWPGASCSSSTSRR
jgi:hypothetical protein